MLNSLQEKYHQLLFLRIKNISVRVPIFSFFGTVLKRFRNNFFKFPFLRNFFTNMKKNVIFEDYFIGF